MNKLVVDLLQQKRWGCWKVLKKNVDRKQKCFLSSQTRWSWQNKRACTSFWTCLSSPGHWSHTQEPSSSHAAASTFKACARKQNLLMAHNMLGQIKIEIPWYINRHTLIYRKRDGKPRMIGGQFVVVRVGSTNSASLQTPLILCLKSAVNSCMVIACPVWTARTYNSHPCSPWKALSNWAVQQALERGCKLKSAWTTLRKMSLLVLSILLKSLTADRNQ